MKVQLGKWGRSLAVRLPKRLVERFDLKEGDEIDDTALERALEETLAENRCKALEEIAERRFAPPAGYKFDREEANAR